MSKFSFCESFVFLQRKPLLFADRPYLGAIYASRRNLVLRCSRQTEKSTFLVNTIVYEAVQQPGIQILFVCPRQEQAQTVQSCAAAGLHRPESPASGGTCSGKAESVPRSRTWSSTTVRACSSGRPTCPATPAAASARTCCSSMNSRTSPTASFLF